MKEVRYASPVTLNKLRRAFFVEMVGIQGGLVSGFKPDNAALHRSISLRVYVGLRADS